MHVYVLLSVLVCLFSLYLLHNFSYPSECVVVVTGESFRVINCEISSDLIELSKVIKPRVWGCL
uniref:Movement protein TGBp3 n=1 Tax=Chrysanthemum virus R TaxID=2116736 RepID=A0A7G7XYH1_9VIRU|nr:TGB3 protein [Chrysanthemum virus R]